MLVVGWSVGLTLTNPHPNNPPQWYTAVISEVVPDEEDERGEDKYLVTFDGYGNQEVVTLGDLMLPPPPTSGKGEGSGDGGGGGARRSRSRCDFGLGFGLVWLGGMAACLS